MSKSKFEKNSYQMFKEMELAEKFKKISKPIIIADGLRTPENIGAVLRVAANVGAEKVYFVQNNDKHFKDYRVFRTSSGAEEKMKWKNVQPDEVESLVPNDYKVLALETVSGATCIFNFTFPEKVAFIIGNEVNGISDRMLKTAHDTIYIPVPGIISSINVSHCLAIAAFEWLRQMNSALKL